MKIHSVDAVFTKCGNEEVAIDRVEIKNQECGKIAVVHKFKRPVVLTKGDTLDLRLKIDFKE